MFSSTRTSSTTKVFEVLVGSTSSNQEQAIWFGLHFFVTVRRSDGNNFHKRQPQEITSCCCVHDRPPLSMFQHKWTLLSLEIQRYWYPLNSFITKVQCEDHSSGKERYYYAPPEQQRFGPNVANLRPPPPPANKYMSTWCNKENSNKLVTASSKKVD